MSTYHTLNFVPVYAPDAAPPPDPDLKPYAARKAKAKLTFLRQLVDHADEPFVGLKWDVPDLGRILIQIDLVQHTAALVTIGRYAEPPEACSLLATAVLLSGFPEADDAALDLLGSTAGFCDNPYLSLDAYEPARTAARPLLVECFITQPAFQSPHLRTLIQALADAFFDQFGCTSNEPEDDHEADHSLG
jgi:hypothetical protein